MKQVTLLANPRVLLRCLMEKCLTPLWTERLSFMIPQVLALVADKFQRKYSQHFLLAMLSFEWVWSMKRSRCHVRLGPGAVLDLCLHRRFRSSEQRILTLSII